MFVRPEQDDRQADKAQKIHGKVSDITHRLVVPGTRSGQTDTTELFTDARAGGRPC